MKTLHPNKLYPSGSGSEHTELSRQYLRTCDILTN